MSLFKKKKEETNRTSCCRKESTPAEISSGTLDSTTCCDKTVDGICCVKVLGAGCKSCHELYENTKVAVVNAGLNLEVEYVTDMEKVMAYGAMSMPALVVNDKVVSVGRVLKPSDVEKLLK